MKKVTLSYIISNAKFKYNLTEHRIRFALLDNLKFFHIADIAFCVIVTENDKLHAGVVTDKIRLARFVYLRTGKLGGILVGCRDLKGLRIPGIKTCLLEHIGDGCALRVDFADLALAVNERALHARKGDILQSNIAVFAAAAYKQRALRNLSPGGRMRCRQHRR